MLPNAAFNSSEKATETLPPASRFSPMRAARPVPKMVSVRPVTFWLARRVMVRKLYSSPPRAEAAKAARKEITRHTSPEGSGLLNS